MIYFSRYVHKKAIKLLSLHYRELMRKLEEHERKYLMVVDCMLDKVLDKIKEVTGIEKIDDLKTLIETNDK